MRKFLLHHTPPGIEIGRELRIFGLGALLAALYSCFFFGRYKDAYDHLFYYVGKERYLADGAQMAPFGELLGTSLAGFVVLALVMLCFVLYHYAYFRQGSRSVYLMKRLPQRGEYLRRIWTVPVLLALAALLLGVLFGGIYLLYYLHRTPQECLPEQIWQEAGRVLL